ncbi:MAG: sulfate/molybdate ABC transporter ATP-binding protein [Beutenbergiaceae bacterium]
MSGSLQAQVVVTRGQFTVDARMDVTAGATLALMGPSGAGKSTILSAIARRIPMRGFVHIDGEPARGVVLLGQDPRLFPHLSARSNVAFGLRARGVRRRVADARADEWLGRVGLDGYGDRPPKRLSGGQQQRVAVARALATSPSALLLDEPLTALDVETAAQVRAVLREALAATGTTAIIATHDAVDAVALASDLIVLENGTVTQCGPMRTVLSEPATRFVAAVAGLNRVPGLVRHGQFEADQVVLGPAPAGHAGDGEAIAVFRPADVSVQSWADDHADVGPGRWLSRIEAFEFTPGGVRVRVARPDIAADMSADVAADLGLTPGARVVLSVNQDAMRLLHRVSIGSA